MFGLFLILLLGYGVYVMTRYSAKELHIQRLTQLGPDAIARERDRLSQRRARYTRRNGNPKFHKTALLPFAPYALLFLFPVFITVFFTRDLLAFTIMFLGMASLAGAFFYRFNLEERRKHNENLDSEDFVTSSVAGLDDFTVPEEWSKKYL